MTDELSGAITAIKSNKYSFCKFVSPNDAGTTGAHQAGLYIPKNSIQLIFDEPGIAGSNKEKFAVIEWSDHTISRCRFIYYGQGTRDEYRVTRLGKTFNVNDLIIIVKISNEQYCGFLLKSDDEKEQFLNAFGLVEGDTNKLIVKPEPQPDPKLPHASGVSPIPMAIEGVETYQINFKPKAHILILLGEELIKDPVMAIYELIKNGYDADATTINVSFFNIENIDNARIEIRDTGTGITEDVLQNVWFEPGTDFRKPVDNAGTRTIKRSPVFGRIPMGEKGVGRFAVHKLGNKIKMVSRPAIVILDEEGKYIQTNLLDYEIIVNIDWRKFSQSKYLDDVIIDWVKNTDSATFMFPDTHGTFIGIESLKEEWSRGMARTLKKQTLAMLSPKNDPSKFSIGLDFQNWWLHNIPDNTALLNIAPYKLNVLVDSKYNMTFDYSFMLTNNAEIGSRIIGPESQTGSGGNKYEYNIKGQLKPYLRETLEQQELEKPVIENIVTEFDEAELPFGNIMLELYSWDLDSPSLKDVTNSPKLVKDLLRDHSGIKVFKGDLRVYDYGDPGNDWMGLDIKRVNNKEWFSNNQIIGYIYLDAATSGTLIEKTNREGFIHNTAYDNFITVLDFILSSFMAERQTDRQRWLKFNRKDKGQNTFANQLTGFRQLISTASIDENSRILLLEEADRVEEKYEEDRNTLLIPAGVGMTASFAMHEIEKLVPRMQETVRQAPINEFRITSQVEELRDYSEGLLSVLRKGTNAAILALQTVEQAVSNHSMRLTDWNIHIDIHHEPEAETIICDKRLFITVVMNLIDNSIYWLDTVFKDFKGIYISITKIENGVSVLVVDNGPGFQENVEDIIRPYYSRKRNGIGIGMYLVDTVMIQYGRLNIIFDRDELISRGVPETYSGAAVELIFNKNQ